MIDNPLDDFVKAYQGDIQYDFDNEILLNWYPKRILAQTPTTNSVLELGLGHGHTTNIFSAYYQDYTVLDGSKAVIENFKKKHPDCNAKIIETYFESFQTETKFDIIVMGFILEHVEDPIGILRHYKPFLKDDGKMFIAVPNAEVMNRRLGYLAGLLPEMQLLSENDNVLGHKRYYTIDELKYHIQLAGYEILKIEGIYLKPLTSNQMISLKLDRKILDALCLLGVYYPELSCGILAEIAVR